MKFTISSIVQSTPLSSFKRFLLPKKKPHTHEAVTFHSSFFPALGGYSSAFRLYRIMYSRSFIDMKSYNLWPFVSAFFHLV